MCEFCSQKKEYFTERQVIRWFIQLTMAVQYMHSKKILHRYELAPTHCGTLSREHVYYHIN